jgi:hypothetical protein
MLAWLVTLQLWDLEHQQSSPRIPSPLSSPSYVNWKSHWNYKQLPYIEKAWYHFDAHIFSSLELKASLVKVESHVKLEKDTYSFQVKIKRESCFHMNVLVYIQYSYLLLNLHPKPSTRGWFLTSSFYINTKCNCKTTFKKKTLLTLICAPQH